MRPFVEQALARLGAVVVERTGDASRVAVPATAPAAALLGGEGGCTVYFGPGDRHGDGEPGVSAKSLLIPLKQALDRVGRSRHGVIDAARTASRAKLTSAVGVFLGKMEKCTTRRRWRLTVRCHARVMVIAGEIRESLVAVDVHPDGTASRAVGGEPLIGSHVRPAQRPPVALRKVARRIDAGMEALQEMAADEARRVRERTGRELYETLLRLRDYHRQVMDEAERDGDAAAARAASSAYEMRKSEEIRIAAGRIRISLVAVESVAHAVTEVTWQVRRGGHGRSVRAVFSRQDGEVLAPVRCGICEKACTQIGLSGSGALVCRNCWAACAVCGAEVVAADCLHTRICEICRRVVCDTHAAVCGDCGRRICPDHMVTCACGCRVCRDCANCCPDCGETLAWCRHHSLRSETGEVVCREHAVFCAGCQNPFAQSTTAVCRTCGQVLCRRCQVVCRHCGGVFCLHHASEERCESCQQTNSDPEPFHQATLF